MCNMVTLEHVYLGKVGQCVGRAQTLYLSLLDWEKPANTCQISTFKAHTALRKTTIQFNTANLLHNNPEWWEKEGVAASPIVLCAVLSDTRDGGAFFQAAWSPSWSSPGNLSKGSPPQAPPILVHLCVTSLRNFTSSTTLSSDKQK